MVVGLFVIMMSFCGKVGTTLRTFRSAQSFIQVTVVKIQAFALYFHS